MRGILYEALDLSNRAEAHGLILTISREPNPTTPLAMGNHRAVIRLDTAHKVYRQPGTPSAEAGMRYPTREGVLATKLSTLRLMILSGASKVDLLDVIDS